MSDEKSEESKNNSWWQTLPGILTGVAATLTAVGSLIAVLYQNGVLNKGSPSDSFPNGSTSSPTIVSPKPVVTQSPASDTVSTPNNLEQIRVRAGHYSFKLLETKVEPYPGGNPPKVLLRCQVKITDLVGVSDYIDSQTIRLLVEDAELSPENSINIAIYEKQSEQIEVLFIIPADANQVVLLVGRNNNGVAKIPIDLKVTTPSSSTADSPK